MNKKNYIASINLFFPVLFMILVFASHSYSQNTKELISQIKHFEKKGDNLNETDPDSAIYYYQKSLKLIEDRYTGNYITQKYPAMEELESKLLNKIGLIFHLQNKFSFAEDYYKKGLNAAINARNDSLIAESYFSLGEIYLENGSYLNAINSYTESIKIFERLKLDDCIFWGRIGIGIVYRECGNTELSKSNYEKALTLAKTLKNENFTGICNNNLGNLYSQTGKYEIALNYLQKALRNFKEAGKEKFESDCLESIGNVYFQYGDYVKAIDYFNQSKIIAERLNDNYRLFSRYANIAKTYLKQDENDKALIYFSKTLELAKSIGDKSRMGEVLIMFSEYYNKNDDYKNSEIYLNNALQISREIGDTVSIARAMTSLAELNFKFKNYDMAYSYAQQAYGLGMKKDLLKTIQSTTYYLALISKLKGKYKDAFNYLNINSAVKDSLLNSERIKIMEETEAKFNLEKVEKDKLQAENEKLIAEEQINKMYLFILLLIIVVSVLSVFLGRYILKRKNEKIKNVEKANQLNKQIDLLNCRLNEKNRELTSKALLIANNNGTLEEVCQSIDDYLANEHHDKNRLIKLKNKIKNITNEESWDSFLQHFQVVHPGFYQRLQEKYPDLSPGEQRICAFLRMKLNTKEIAQISGQSVKSIEVARTRIRKKLSIDHGASLTNSIQKI